MIGILTKQGLAALAGVMLTATGIGAAAVYAPPMPALGKAADDETAPLPPGPPPPVEPLELKAVAPETAREINAAIPFADITNPPARPFVIGQDAPSFGRARDCLAAAGYYEAGDDSEGQRSVMQVVLNRVRHPAYPKTVCGVVFQGQERRTGCQFTFTCDGAMRRRPSEAAWARARATASQALGGGVYKQVGVATHYHTDWVVPYWSDSLLKIAKVQTHLFFRWPGGWGSLAAFRGRYAGAEPGIVKLASLSPAHGEALVDAKGNPLPGVDMTAVEPSMAAVRKVLFRSDEEFLVLFKPSAAAADLPAAAQALCAKKEYCKLRGWTDASVAPSQLPVKDAQREAMAFSYLRDPDKKFERLLWDCKTYKRPDKDECIKGTYEKPDKDEKREAKREGKEKVSLRRILGIDKDDEPEKKEAPVEAKREDDKAERRRPGQGQ